MITSGLITPGGYALITPEGEWLVTGNPAAEYRFLKDHWISENYVRAGDTLSEGTIIPVGWEPTADVEPLNVSATDTFYAAGPCLPGLINSQWTRRIIYAPETYWYQVSPFLWALSGLGEDQLVYPPVLAYIERVE